MITFKELQEKLSDKEYKEVDALLNRDTLLRGNLIKNYTQRGKFETMKARDTFRRIKKNEDGKLRIDRGTEKKIKVNRHTVSKNFPELSKKPVEKYKKYYRLPEAAMAIPAVAGIASKVLPAAAATIGAIGTMMQARKGKRKLSRMQQKMIDLENKRGENITNVDPNKDMIKPKKGEVKKTEELIGKYKATNKVIKPKEGEVAKQRELLKNVERKITKPKKGEKKDASKTVKDFLKARKKEGETMYKLKQDAEIADKGPGDLLPAAKKTYLDKLLRNLRKEEAMVAPTNNVGGGQIAGTVEAGDNPPVKKKKRYIYGGTGSRKMWMNNK